jgi:hypothetical protein
VLGLEAGSWKPEAGSRKLEAGSGSWSKVKKNYSGTFASNLLK